MKIGIFCSANDNIDKSYFNLTEELGKWMANKGHALVYGGGNSGLMESIGKAVHEAGGQTIAMVPRIMEEDCRMSKYVDVHFPCEDLTDRKALIMEQSDVFIALPGGIGTLDEVFTVAASHTIGYHNKPMLLYNMNGFWDAAIHLLEDMQKRGMIRGHYTKYIKVVKSIEEIEESLIKIH